MVAPESKESCWLILELTAVERRGAASSSERGNAGVLRTYLLDWPGGHPSRWPPARQIVTAVRSVRCMTLRPQGACHEDYEELDVRRTIAG